MNYPVLKYTPYSIPFKRICVRDIVWPSQPTELVFTTPRIVALISTYSSTHPVQYACIVLARVCKHRPPAPSPTLQEMLCVWMPRAAVDLFLVKDSRGVSPWVELLKRTGVVIRPQPSTRTLVTAGVRHATWLVAQTEENHRVFVHVMNRRIVCAWSLKRGPGLVQFEGLACTVKESASLKSGSKRVFLCIDDGKFSWSVVALGHPVVV